MKHASSGTIAFIKIEGHILTHANYLSLISDEGKSKYFSKLQYIQLKNLKARTVTLY